MGVHGKPDWGLQLKQTVYTLDDLSELAVRLGSISFFDRRGDVVLLENFKNGLAKWYTWGDGDGNEVLITADRVRTGGYSAKLIGGRDGTRFAGMWLSIPYSVLSKYGFEVHFSMGSKIDIITFTIRKYTGTQGIEASIRYDRTNQKLQYRDTTGAYQDIETSFILSQSDFLFHVFKILADLENNKYNRLIVNETGYILSAYDMYSYPSSVSKHLEFNIHLFSRQYSNDYVYADNIIITQNEP